MSLSNNFITRPVLTSVCSLLIVIAGAVSHDILGSGVTSFRRALWLGTAAAIGGGLFVESTNIASLIGWSSSIAASSICPLLILGIWWPEFTRRGAWAIVTIGGGTARVGHGHPTGYIYNTFGN